MTTDSLRSIAIGFAGTEVSHYGVTGSMRSSWVRLSLFDELESRATSGGNRS